MEYRLNKADNTEVSLLGMGCMRFPLISGTEEIDTQLVQQMVDFAIENGVNYFDTAYPYHGGKSEEVIGKALSKYKRESFYLADKMPLWKIQKQEDLHDTLTEQLTRCNVDYFDYYLCHAVSKERIETIEKFEICKFLDKKKQEGVLRRVGFSFHDSPAVLRSMCKMYKWDFVQLQINYFDWELGDARKLYDIAVQFGLQVIIMEPVRGGALASLNENANKVLSAHSPNNSIASWALRYAASLPQVLCVLSGMSNMEQLVDNVKSMSPFSALSKQEHTVLMQAFEKFKAVKTVPCTGCRYCMDCPFGVDIPAVFDIYNKTALAYGDEQFVKRLSRLKKSERPQSCTACGKCAKACPQKIKIPQLMKSYCEMK